MIIKTKNEQETQKFGQRFAQCLKGGEIIGLSGELGSGKTTFVKGLARGLKIKELITSPTFILLREHHSISTFKPLSLVHIDLYRLKSKKEIETIGLLDYLGKPDKVCIIEWAEKAKDILRQVPGRLIWIKFKHIDENTRQIYIKNHYGPFH